MKISELQEKLEEIRTEAGDLSVAIIIEGKGTLYFDFDPKIDILEIPTEDYKKLYVPICVIGQDTKQETLEDTLC